MSREAILERILLDAEAEAENIVAEAQAKAAAAREKAAAEAEEYRAEAEAETAEKCAAIAEGKAATARLDCAKILLAEKRKVIAAIYECALRELLALNERDCLALTERLLKAYAGEGDEVVFARSYRYADGAQRLAVAAEKKLKFPKERAEIEGGFLLRGKKSDTDLSYSALLEADREEHQAELAAELFG